MTLFDVHEAGLVAALGGVAGLHVAVDGDESPPLPAAVVVFDRIGYHGDDGVSVGMFSHGLRWRVELAAPRTNARAAARVLYRLLDPGGDVTSSIVAALEADRTLNGACDTLRVLTGRGLFDRPMGGEIVALGSTLEVVTYGDS